MLRLSPAQARLSMYAARLDGDRATLVEVHTEELTG
jgi:hypothetical protein